MRTVALVIGLLNVQDGHVRIDGRYQNDPVGITPAVERVFHHDQFLIRNFGIGFSQLGRKPPLVDDAGAESRARRQEGNSH
jgi:hypothetical protein